MEAEQVHALAEQQRQADERRAQEEARARKAQEEREARRAAEEKAAAEAKAKAEEERRTLVTMAKYNAIREGMTRDQVYEIVGSRGQLSSKGGITTVIWENPDDADGRDRGCLVLDFREGRVIFKTQIGLPR